MAASPVPSKSASAFELKADAFTLPVIRLLALDMDSIAVELEAKVAQAPAFFMHTPVVVDLSALSEADADVGFPQLVGLLRGLGMIPVGVRGGSLAQQEAAKAMELAILGDTFKPRRREDGPQLAAEHAAVPAPDPVGAVATPESPAAPVGIETGPTLITRPVRSGQRVYAAGGDLTVVAAVNPGAELMADGNIHIYGALRGRVIAGLKGDTSARIFCHDLQAELVSVAGHYRVSESIPPELKGQRVQVYLDHEVLRIEPL
jgi:septum site-determining protein MinC